MKLLPRFAALRFCGFVFGLALFSAPAIRAQVLPPATSPLKLPPELPSATGYATLDALPGIRFQRPLCVATPPGETDRLFILEKDTGNIQVITGYGTQPKKSVFMNMPAVIAARNEGTFSTDLELGLLGIAFHPNFAKNGLFYVAYDLTVNEPGGRKLFDRVSQFHVSATDPNAGDPQSEVPLITQLDLANNHNGGDLHFGADGYLYYSMGDEGGGNDGFNNARFIDKDFFAAIYRIDIDKKPGSLPPNPHHQNSSTYPSAVNAGAYAIPPDNPFIGATEHSGRKIDPNRVRTEIWATGLRNPWRFSFDPPSARMFIGDVGQDRYEEVDIGVAGGDFGWSYMEGFHDGPRHGQMQGDVKTIEPIHEYPHANGDNCIIGGVVYRGSRLSELYGDYVFGDIGSRRIWALHQSGDKWTKRVLVERGDDMAAFGVDPRNGDILVASIGAGKINRLVRTGTHGDPAPALLSQTGAFANVAALQPDPALVPYKPNVSFWSDYAVKTRWFVLADPAKKITFSRDDNWTFRTGTIWVKHFDMEMTRGDATTRRRLETRFLVKTAEGVYGITYKWKADQSDAELVPENGTDETLDIKVAGAVQKQVWHYPGRAECIRCHTSVAGGALGFNTRQLNGVAMFGKQHLNELTALSDAGYFTQPVGDIKTMPAFVTADDKTQPIEARVRSYLAVNCVQCHQPGAGAVGLWDARPTTALMAANLINGRLVYDGGDPVNHWMVPGDLAHSMVFKRIRGDGVPRMPPLASTELDPGAADLFTQWIKQAKP